LRRGGRLDIDIRMDMPSAEDRYEVIKNHISLIKNHSINFEEDISYISRAGLISGFVCSDLA
jgi:ATP-dependent 26S proteasome regulatory subunit